MKTTIASQGTVVYIPMIVKEDFGDNRRYEIKRNLRFRGELTGEIEVGKNLITDEDREYEHMSEESPILLNLNQMSCPMSIDNRRVVGLDQYYGMFKGILYLPENLEINEVPEDMWAMTLPENTRRIVEENVYDILRRIVAEENKS
jgi:hypothetical protein